MSLKMGGTGLNGNKLKFIIGTHGRWKNQNPGGRFGATSKTALPIQPILADFLVNGPNWQCSLAGSSKTAPQDFDFFNCHGCRMFILNEIHCYPKPPKKLT